MMQYHYYYVGYLVWGLLFGGVFLLCDSIIMKMFFQTKSNKSLRVALVMIVSFVLLCSGYVLVYYLKNGVLL
jgi:D-alanyl-lipoteichoic acid acyltransferase DltB (MBOAT superfamily)